MRLIDADELKEQCHWVIRSDGSRIWVIHDFDIDEAPTIDAEPVRHGRWVKYGMDIAEHPWHCSECGWSDHHIDQRRVKEFEHCPNCTAKMDEENAK